MGEKTGEYIYQIVKDCDGGYCYIKQGELIRCGECKYREIQGVDGFCDHITGEEIMVRKTDYCSWAERRTDEMQ